MVVISESHLAIHTQWNSDMPLSTFLHAVRLLTHGFALLETEVCGPEYDCREIKRGIFDVPLQHKLQSKPP